MAKQSRWHGVRTVAILLGAIASSALVTVGVALLHEEQRWAFRPHAREEFSAEFAPVDVLPGFTPRAITQFPVKPAAEVADAVNAEELVIGVEVDGAARAYPVNILTGPDREILNDELGGKAIAATW